MIVVTGATGKLGSRIVERLLQLIPADQIGVSVRSPERLAHLGTRGVRVRRGDYAEPRSLIDAFEGADQVLIVSAGATGDNAVRQHVAAIDAARDVGSQRILYTSHMATAATSLFAPMLDHDATEQYISNIEIPYTSLRHGFYASTVPLLLGAALQTGQLVAPADGPVSWTNHADLADAAAIVLTENGRLDGETPSLTASEAHDLDDIARLLSELSGRTIQRVVADDDEWVQGLIEHGVPESQAAMLLGMFRASRLGEFAATDPTLEQLLGRPPLSIRTVLAEIVTDHRT
ncbi:MAG: SDR family oxidoreductase [Thermomicrobiales bacterium]